MMRFVVLMVCACLGTATVMSQTIESVLTSDELSSELFGVYLEGVVGISDEPWSECIEPDGDTIFEHQSETLTGKLNITEDGQACFDYSGVGFGARNCFNVFRNRSGGYVFLGADSVSGQFRTSLVIPVVTSCPYSPSPVG